MRLAELEDAFSAYALGRHIEPPASLSGLDQRRLKVYRRLVLNTVRSPMEGGFPYTRLAVGPALWEALRWGYFEAYPPQRWELNSIMDELPDWLREQFLPAHPEAPPWTADLADYERHELTVYLAPDDAWRGAVPVNPTLVVRQYSFDVPGWVKQTQGKLTGAPAEGQVNLLMYRDPQTLLVRFLHVNPLTSAVLGLLSQGLTLAEVVEQLAEALGVSPQACEPQIDALIQTLREQGVVR